MIRIGYDADAEQVLITGFRQTFDPGTLIAEVVDGEIAIRLMRGDVLIKAEPAILMRMDGTGFAGTADCLAYLRAIFAAPRIAHAVRCRYPAVIALSAARAVRLGPDGVTYADAGTPDDRNAVLGLTCTAADAGAPVDVQADGPLTMPGWGLIPGRPVFLGRDGLVTQDVPAPPLAFALRLGAAATPDCATLRIGPAILLTLSGPPP